MKVEFATDLDNDNVELQFVNGQKEIIPKKTFAISITQTQKDWTYLQNVKLKAMGEEIMKVVLSYDIKMYEAEALVGYLVKEIKGRHARATNYLWNKDDSRYIPGTDPTDFISLAECERIIESIPPKNLKDEPQSTTE